MTTEIDKNLLRCRTCKALLARLIRDGQAIRLNSAAILYHPVTLFCRNCNRSRKWQPLDPPDMLTPEQKTAQEQVRQALGKDKRWV